MNLQLIDGHYNYQDAMEIISRLVEAKIRFHENKIDTDLDEDDIKMREKKIKTMQTELSRMRSQLRNEKNISIHAAINFSKHATL
jgi:hypothetical protein